MWEARVILMAAAGDSDHARRKSRGNVVAGIVLRVMGEGVDSMSGGYGMDELDAARPARSAGTILELSLRMGRLCWI